MRESASPNATAASNVSVIVLSWNTPLLLRACLQSLREANDGLSLEIIVVDNGSADESPDLVAQEFPECILVRNQENRGYALGVNQGLERATGRHVALLGSDTRVRPGTLAALVRYLDEHPDVGAVAPPLLNEDTTRQGACSRFPTLRTALVWDTFLERTPWGRREVDRYLMRDWDHRGTREVDQPPGTCLVVRRSVVESVGPMDGELWLFFNDVDWCRRIWSAGHRIVYVECPGVFHRQSSSTKNFAQFALVWHRNRIAYYRKHHPYVGTAITKGAVLYVALRACFQTARRVPIRELWSHCRVLLQAAWSLVR